MRHFLILFFILSFNLAQAETLYFDIFYKGWDVGDLTSKITRNGDEMDIAVTCKVVAKLIITVEVKYIMKTKYKNNELESSSVITFVNGKEYNKMIVTRKGDYYDVDDNGESRKYTGKITCSEAYLCILEPTNIPFVFSEFDAISKPMIKTGTNKYRTSNPKNNNFTDLVYQNGLLFKSTIHYTVATFEIRLRKD